MPNYEEYNEIVQENMMQFLKEEMMKVELETIEQGD